MNQKYICACGLNCRDCLFFNKEIYETAKKLHELIEKSQMNTFLSLMSKMEVNSSIARHLNVDQTDFNNYFQIFNKIPEFMNVLEGLINIECKTTCQESGGCSMCGSKKECSAIKCIKERNIAGCWDCTEYKNCPNLSFQRMNYGKTIDENFKIIKEQGIQAVPSRNGDYYEWQRKMKDKKTTRRCL